MVVREDVWANETCLVCQAKYNSDAKRNQHENESAHKTKVVVFDFLMKELQIRLPSNVDSMLFDRYSRANAAVPGLDCMCELKFSWAKTSFWVCTVCYEVGTSLDSADSHVYGRRHRENYLSVHCPEQYETLMTTLKSSAADQLHYVEHRAVQTLLYESKCLSPPDVYIFEDCNRQWALKMLGLDDMQSECDYLLEPISDYHQLVQCLSCGENFFAYEKPEQLQLAWNVHLSSNRHQHCRQMLTLLDEEQIQDKDGVPAFCHVKSDVVFNEFNNAYYGPTCGYEFLVDFSPSKECFCMLCFCAVPKQEATEHFSCEFHVERFARRFNPSKLLGAEYMKPAERQQILVEAMSQRGKCAPRHRVHAGVMPRLLRQFAFVDRRAFSTTGVQETSIGLAKAIWCRECVQYIRLQNRDAWMDHLMDEEHFESCTKRALYYLDEKNLVPNRAELVPFRKAGKGWTDKFCVVLGRPLAVEDHCYYGLQYVIRDELGRISVCLCCHFIANYDQEDMMSIHVRSYDHLARIMHLTNKKFLDITWKSDSTEKCKAYLLDYLKHCKLDAVVDSPIVYDPVSALNANCYGRISRWILELARMPPETREISLAILKLDDFSKDKVPFNVAMRQANVEIRHIESSVVSFCQECNQAFSSTMENIKEKFAEHIFSLSHWTRQQSLLENRLDENKRILGQTSCFTVSPYLQTNEKKKVTWKWNEQRSAFEFVYAQLGLSDIRERRNMPKTKRDLYCNLCAESFKASKFELERHVRSLPHVFYYVHNHRFQAIPEIEAALLVQEDVTEKHKNLRRLLAKTLKDLEKEQGELSIYDMSIKFCDIPEIKLVVESDGQGVVATQKLLKDGVHNNGESEEECEAFAIYACDFDKTSPAEIQQRLVYLTNKSGTDETDLDFVKRQIMKATLAGKNNSSATGESTSSTASDSAERSKSSKAAESSRNSVSSLSRTVASPTYDRSGSATRSALFSSTSSERERDRSIQRPTNSSSLTSSSNSISHTLKQCGDVINRISSSSVADGSSARTSENKNRKSSKDAPIGSSSSLRRPGSNARQRSVTPPRGTSIHRSRSPAERNNRDRTDRRTQSTVERDDYRNSFHYRLTRSNDRSSSSTSRGSRSLIADSIRQSTKRRCDLLYKSSAEESSKNKLSFNVNALENSTAQKAYRIRNAPEEPLNSSRYISVVDPHAKDDQEMNDNIITSGKLSAPEKQTPLLRADTPKSSDAAHAKAVQEFLQKTVGGKLPDVPTTMTSANLPLMRPLPPGVVPTTFFGPMAGMIQPAPFMMPPFGSMPPFPPVVPFMSAPFSGSIPPPMTPTPVGGGTNEMLLRAKMELCMKDLFNIKTSAELIDYMWNQGVDKIAPTEHPLLFNAVAKKRRGLLGCNMLYQIICYEHPELETYYCGLCNHWTTVSEMFNHLITPLHRLNYMHRNYKVYHRRATEEYEGATRTKFLDQMADHIWDIEGSGECRNRMRCVLNEEAIMRIWPDVVNNIDHSWKIHDFELKTEPTVTPVVEAPARSSPELTADVDMDVYASNSAHNRDQNSSERRDSRTGVKSKSSRDDERSSKNEKSDYDRRVSRTTTISKDHRTGDRHSSPTSRKKREHSRTPSRQHHSRSRSPRCDRSERERRRDSSAERNRRRDSSAERNRRRDSSAERNRRRDSSAERNRRRDSPAERNRRRNSPAERNRRRDSPSGKRRYSHSPRERTSTCRPETQASKSPKSLFNYSVPKKKSETWDQKAAAFLDRIGNRKDAACIFLSTIDDGSTSEPVLKFDAAPSFGSKHQLPSGDSYVISSSSTTKPPCYKSMEERLRGAAARSLAHGDRAGAVSEIVAELERTSIPSILDRSSKDHHSQKNRFESSGRSSAKSSDAHGKSDDKAEMRKTIGAIVELQSTFETEKRIDGAVIFKVCEDMGIAAKDVLVNPLLHEAAQMYQLNLATAYEEWITRKFLEAQQQQQRQMMEQERNQGSLKGAFSSELMDILRKVNMVPSQSKSTANSFVCDNDSNVDFGPRRKPYEPELNNAMNFVYDADDFQKARKSDDAAGPAPDFQRFSDEESADDCGGDNDAEDAAIEEKRAALQSFAEANGLRPEIAAAAAAAAIKKQTQGKKKRKKKPKEWQPPKSKKPNANLEPLGTNARSFGANFPDSGSDAAAQLRRMPLPAAKNLITAGLASKPPPSDSSALSFDTAIDNFASSPFMAPPPPMPAPKLENASKPSNIPFNVSRALQNFQCAVTPLQKNILQNVEKIPSLVTISPQLPSSLAGAPVSYASQQQQSLSAAEQQRQQQIQRAFNQQDATPVYQRVTLQPLRQAGGMNVPPPVVRKPPTAAVNANVIDLASQIGDDWGSMNSYLSNLLKNPKTGAAPNK